MLSKMLSLYPKAAEALAVAVQVGRAAASNDCSSASDKPVAAVAADEDVPTCCPHNAVVANRSRIRARRW